MNIKWKGRGLEGLEKKIKILSMGLGKNIKLQGTTLYTPGFLLESKNIELNNFFNINTGLPVQAMFFWYLVKIFLSSVRFCTDVHWTRQVTRNTRPCLTGHPVYKNYLLLNSVIQKAAKEARTTQEKRHEKTFCGGRLVGVDFHNSK